MNSKLLLGTVPHELACAVALGIVEDPHIAPNADAVTVYDAHMRPLGTVPNWLAGNDPLDAATRDYLRAKREATMTTVRRPGQSAWNYSAATRARDGANERARQARALGRGLLAERGVLDYAQGNGLRVMTLD